MQSFEYSSAKTSMELCQLLQTPGRAIIAGGTDLIPQMRSGKSLVSKVIDISQIQELKIVQRNESEFRIGSMVTFHDLINNPSIQKQVPLLWLASREVGAPTTRSRATLGGNIANASPAADSIPPLLCLNANLHLQNISGEHVISLEQFLIGPGKTKLMQGDFIKFISFSIPQKGYQYAYIKNGARRGMSISVVSVSVSFLLENGVIFDPRIAVGAAAPTAIRCRNAEDSLKGCLPTQQNWSTAAHMAANETIPISDIRASRDYRQKAVAILVERALASTQILKEGGNHATH